MTTGLMRFAGPNVEDLLIRACGAVQLSPTQHQEAVRHYGAIGRVLDDPGVKLAAYSPVIFPQGSMASETTVKPLKRKGFDLDAIVHLQINPREVYNPLALRHLVFEPLKDHGTYRSMVSLEPRCVRVTYGGDFHLDIVAGCTDPEFGAPCILIPDEESTTGWKGTNPKGFVDWFNERADLAPRFIERIVQPVSTQTAVAKKPVLKLVVQLLKRSRDIWFAKRSEEPPPSVLLTNLVGKVYRGQDRLEGAVSDILDRLRNMVLENPGPLIVRNPVHPTEIHSELWTKNPGAYTAFVNYLSWLSSRWAALMKAEGLDSVGRILEELFGEEITKIAMNAQGDAVHGARLEGSLAVERGTGQLGSVSILHSAVKVPNHLFHGS